MWKYCALSSCWWHLQPTYCPTMSGSCISFLPCWSVFCTSDDGKEDFESLQRSVEACTASQGCCDNFISTGGSLRKLFPSAESPYGWDSSRLTRGNAARKSENSSRKVLYRWRLLSQIMWFIQELKIIEYYNKNNMKHTYQTHLRDKVIYWLEN